MHALSPVLSRRPRARVYDHLRFTLAAIRAYKNKMQCGGTYGSCTHLRGFADRCVTAPPRRHLVTWIIISENLQKLDERQGC